MDAPDPVIKIAGYIDCSPQWLASMSNGTTCPCDECAGLVWPSAADEVDEAQR